jgi:hypothetical protein
MICQLLPIIAIGASLFDMQTLPLPSQQTRITLVAADSDTTADIAVQAGLVLTMYMTTLANYPVSITLPQGTSAYDIADLDGDLKPELVAICRERIISCKIPLEGVHEEFRDLFSLKTMLSDYKSDPFPYVLAVVSQGRLVLALPCVDSLELRTIGGVSVASFPTGPNAPQRVSMGRPFYAQPIKGRALGGPGAIKMRVTADIETEPELPEGLLPMGRRPSRPFIRRLDSDEPDAKSWSGFPLRVTEGSDDRVYFSQTSGGADRTLIRLQTGSDPAKDIKDENLSMGPPREYPGTLMVTDELPDFNSDGFTDLLLWSAPEPAMSVDALTRAVTGQVWPISISAHLYSPQKNRYEPVPAGQIKCKIPILWFLLGDARGPVQHRVLKDFNGDGRTDFGCATDPQTYCVWLAGDSGFAGAADFTMKLTEPIIEIAFSGDLGKTGRTTLGLRSKKNLYILRPAV